MNAELRTEALAGPWEAVLTDRYGNVVTTFELREEFEDDPDEARISIVRLSAVPSGPDADGERRLPGMYNGDDHLVEWNGFDDCAEIEARWVQARWVQAQAMVAGLNAAGA